MLSLVLQEKPLYFLIRRNGKDNSFRRGCERKAFKLRRIDIKRNEKVFEKITEYIQPVVAGGQAAEDSSGNPLLLLCLRYK